ncbi:MAG: AraC family transcriptional regulator [Clostridia bacterium]|nr:AraC family transcriptional regulator [Clostridia bacterium]
MYDNLIFLRGGIQTAGSSYTHISRSGVHSTELIMVTEGVLYMFVGEERYTLSRGDVLRIPPEAPHGGYRECEGVSFIWLHMTGISEDELPNTVIKPLGFDRATLLAREILHYSASLEMPAECADYLARVLIAELTVGEESSGRALRGVKEFLKERGGMPSTAEEVARALGYSEDYLSRLLKRSLGVGLKQYIDRVRLDSIKRELLLGEMTLAELGAYFGFSDYKSFLKFFKYHEGVTPTEFINSY